MVSLSLQQLLISLYMLLMAGIMYIYPHPLVPLAFGVLPILIWALMRFSYYVVISFVVFSFFRIHEVFPIIEPLKLPLVLALATLFVVFIRHVFINNLQPFWCKQFTYLLLFFFVVSLSVPLASNVDVATKAWTNVYSKIILMTFVIAWMMREERHFISTCRVFMLMGACVGLVTLYNQINGIGLVEGSRVTIGRDIGSLLGDPNDLALVLLYPMAYCIATFLERQLGKLQRILGFVIFLILFFAIIATQSRGGLLGFLAIIGLFASTRIKSKSILFTVSIVLFFILFAVAGISDRASGGNAEIGIDESAMGRLYAWQAAWNMGLDNPIFGVGISNFYYNYFFYSTHWDGLNHAVHSTWLGVLAETGILGLYLFIHLVTITFSTAWQMSKRPDLGKLSPGMRVAVHAAPAGIIGFVVSGTFLTQGFLWPIYLQLALVAALQHYFQTNLDNVPLQKINNNGKLL
jgi:probable O-glycosylation ligase (exosortase A-associated)